MKIRLFIAIMMLSSPAMAEFYVQPSFASQILERDAQKNEYDRQQIIEYQRHSEILQQEQWMREQQIQQQMQHRELINAINGLNQ